jgi:hypothetical protein
LGDVSKRQFVVLKSPCRRRFDGIRVQKFIIPGQLEPLIAILLEWPLYEGVRHGGLRDMMKKTLVLRPTRS